MLRPTAVAGILPLARAAAASRPTAQANINVYFGNLHSHTAVSDGSGTPAEVYENARDIAGLDFLALTEHNHMDIAGNPQLYAAPARNRSYVGPASPGFGPALVRPQPCPSGSRPEVLMSSHLNTVPPIATFRANSITLLERSRVRRRFRSRPAGGFV